ncbi:MAG: UMP kinase [Anaerolineae bacterium]|nr:UMP kinase [Anaerolineae bacterium]MDQ7034071.1 UMP kinase [Anaerolineae bacterium]
MTTQNGNRRTPYKRILLKLSGEALRGENETPISIDKADFIAEKLQQIYDLDIQIAVVIGAGNIWRGSMGLGRGMDRTTADHMGMIGTVMNGLALRDALERRNLAARVQTAIHMNEVAEPYIRLRAIRHMEKGRVVILAGGTGNPFFTTDSAAALRANELEVDIIIKATKVNGVYSDDPKKNPDATRYSLLTYQDVLSQHLNVMDMTAFTLCQENNMPIRVVNFWEDDNLLRAIKGEMEIGTLIR